MKKSELIFSAILVPLDYLMIILAALSAYFFRYSDFYTKYIREAGFFFQLSDFTEIIITVALGWLVIFALAGIYTIRADRKLFNEITKIFLATSTGILAIVIYIFFQRELFASRFIVLAGWAIAFVYVSVAHIIVRKIQKSLLRKGVGLHRLALIGSDEITKKLVREYELKPELGYKVVGVFAGLSPLTKNELIKIKNSLGLDELMLGDANLSREESMEIINFAEENN